MEVTQERLAEISLINPFLGTFNYEANFGIRAAPLFTQEHEQFKGYEALEEILDLYEYATPLQKREIDLLLQGQGGTDAPLLPHQIVPFWRDDWEVMALEGGRGTGKTVCGSSACIEVLRNQGRKARIGIGAPTNSDVRDVCIEGETGLWTLYGDEFKTYNRSLGTIELRHRNGGYVRAMGTEKVSKWNGPQWSWLWFDEYALCNPQSVTDANLALRLGPKRGPYRARMLVTFTPKGMRWVNEILGKPDTYIPHYIGQDGKPRRPTTFDNPYLPAHRVQKLKEQYMGTRIGMRELLGIEIGGVLGAKWTQDIIRYAYDPEKWPKFTRIVVAIDPGGTSLRRKADANALSEKERQNLDKRSKTSICVKAKGTDGRNYTLAWVAGHWTPNEWATKAIEFFHLFKADRFVAERNYGGDMVENTLRNVWRDAPITIVVATRGKEQRAEPVVALYEQGIELHCLVFAEGEAQMCAFINADDNEGADYVDSSTWATWELMGWNETQMGSLIVPASNNDWQAYVVR